MPEKMDMSPAVDRKEGETVITKHTASIFIGTDFERMVRNAGITNIIFTGISTELGVESSARDALNRDFYPVIVSYTVLSSHKNAHARSLQNIERFLGSNLRFVMITILYKNSKFFLESSQII